MERQENKKYQIIGACTSMQIVSWEMEFELIKGITYDIDFSQDFSAISFEEEPIESIPISDIINTITCQRESCCSFPSAPTIEDLKKSREIREEIEKIIKKERRREKKWKKHHQKPKNTKEAFENLERVVEELMKR